MNAPLVPFLVSLTLSLYPTLTPSVSLTFLPSLPLSVSSSAPCGDPGPGDGPDRGPHGPGPAHRGGAHERVHHHAHGVHDGGTRWKHLLNGCYKFRGELSQSLGHLLSPQYYSIGPMTWRKALRGFMMEELDGNTF